MDRDIKSEFWQEVEDRKEGSKIFQKVYNWLNNDCLGGIILSGNVFWVELQGYGSTLPNYILNFIKKWGKKRGYIYLYDLPERG